MDWLALMQTELGVDWMRRERFRIGASSLLDDLERDAAALRVGELETDLIEAKGLAQISDESALVELVNVAERAFCGSAYSCTPPRA